LRRALHVLEAVFSPAHEITDIPRWDLARTLQLRGKQADSETLFRYLLKKYERSYGEGNYSTVSALQRLIETLRDQGQLEEARSLLATLLERDGPSEKYEELRQSLAQSEQR
jgi:hypothetical protein